MNVYKMHENALIAEPNIKWNHHFFYGAMYVSYALELLLELLLFITYFCGRKSLAITNFIVIIATLILFMPVIIAYQSIWVEFIYEL